MKLIQTVLRNSRFPEDCSWMGISWHWLTAVCYPNWTLLKLLQRNTVTLTFQENSQESGAISTMPMPVRNLATHVLKTKKLKTPTQVWLNRRVRTALSIEEPLFSPVIMLERLFWNKNTENTVSSIQLSYEKEHRLNVLCLVNPNSLPTVYFKGLRTFTLFIPMAQPLQS